MNTILFPTDFSEAANKAFIYALALADATGARIVTMHSYELPNLRRSNLQHTMAEVYESINLETFQNYRDSVPALRTIAEENGFSAVSVQHVLVEGRTTHAIIRQAKKDKADLIVMGTTGATGLKEIFLGSVAGEIMEDAPCPVLGIPIAATFDAALKKIAFGTNFQKEEVPAMNWLAHWAEVINAEVAVVHIDLAHTEELSPRMPEWSAQFAGQEHLTFHVEDAMDFKLGITNFMEKTKADILATVIHKRNFIQEFFNFSKTKTLAYHLENPILAIPVGVFAEKV